MNVHAAKTHLSRLIDRAAAGEEIVIARSGRPVARLAPLESGGPPRRLGLLRGQIDVDDGFDAPLPRAVLDAIYRSPIEPPRRRRKP